MSEARLGSEQSQREAEVVFVFRWDGAAWERWSALWKRYEPARFVPPPLDAFLAAGGIEPAAGDRFMAVAGEWRRVPPGEPDGVLVIDLTDQPADADADAPR
jgi:hypothetical protein